MTVSLGIDIGTTSIKMCILETNTATILSSERINHSCVSAVAFATEQYSEQSGQHILQKVDECMQKLGQSLSKSHPSCRITSIVISGQMHGVVLWKKLQGSSSPSTSSPPLPPAAVETPLLQSALTHHSSHTEWIKEFNRRIRFETNLITWEDKRCNDTFISCLPPSKFAIHSGYGCATLFWLVKYRTDVIKRSEYAGSIMDLLVAYICDLDEPRMSDQIANSWGYFDTTELSWQTEL